MSAPLTIEEAEERWRQASARHERYGSARTAYAEEKAWEAYAILCDEAGKCLQPGCWKYTPTRAWCDEHCI